jgi:hypothetical protein
MSFCLAYSLEKSRNIRKLGDLIEFGKKRMRVQGVQCIYGKAQQEETQGL